MEKFGVPKHIVSFVLPTGYSFNLDGSTLYLSLAAMFVAQAANVDVPFGTQIVMMLTLMLTSKGVAGVQAVLYDSGDGTNPVATAATADDGSYAFAKLSAGTYRLRFTGAGFTDLWYTAGRVFAEATDIKQARSDAKFKGCMAFPMIGIQRV